MPVVATKTKKEAAAAAAAASASAVSAFFAMEDVCASRLTSERIVKQQDHYAAEIRAVISAYPGAKKAEARDALRTRMAVAVAGTKRLNRLSHYRNRAVRSDVRDERERVDEKFLELQNSVHEIDHLQKESKRCLEFRSGCDSLELVSEAEFYREAPKEISKPDVTKTDPHRRKLAQLAWELEQRKALGNSLAAVEAAAAGVAASVETEREALESLGPKVAAILKATRPVQEQLQMPFEADHAQMDAAAFLPPPLYTAYLQLRAYKEISKEKLTLEIKGDVAEAKAFLKKSASTAEEDGDSGDEGGGGGKEDEGRRRKRKRKDSVSERLAAAKARLTAAHPLTLCLTLPPDQDSTTLRLEFAYLTELEVISLKVSVGSKDATLKSSAYLSRSDVLSSLDVGDSGQGCPNPTGQAKLDKAGVVMPGLGFDWAQRLSGLRFPPALVATAEEETAPAEETEELDFLQGLLRRIRGRLTARATLHRTLVGLEKGDQAVVGGTRGGAVLASWKGMGADEFRLHPAVGRLLGPGESVDGAWFFSATLEVGEAKLVALVSVDVAYPDVAPLFVLLLKWQGATRNAVEWEPLKKLEEAVNCQVPSQLRGSERLNTLQTQVEFLRKRLEVVLEVQAASSLPPSCLYPRKARGPGRDVPLNFHADTNSYHFDDDV